MSDDNRQLPNFAGLTEEFQETRRRVDRGSSRRPSCSEYDRYLWCQGHLRHQCH
jgi:hypothetical protein